MKLVGLADRPPNQLTEQRPNSVARQAICMQPCAHARIHTCRVVVGSGAAGYAGRSTCEMRRQGRRSRYSEQHRKQKLIVMARCRG